MLEFLYEVSSISLIATLLGLMLVANEIGYRIGYRSSSPDTEGTRSRTNATLTSMLGLLALLLGFTFSMSIQRFDNRSDNVISEANAIGTASLRVGLLPEPIKKEARKLMDQYAKLRIESGEAKLTQNELRDKDHNEAEQIQKQLWALGLKAVEIDARPTISGYFIQSLNALIDTYGSRVAAVDKRIPPPVIILLYVVTIITMLVMGFAAGLHRSRSNLSMLGLSLLIALTIFLIIDMERPRRGLIQVSQETLQELSPVQSSNGMNTNAPF